jgi:hypothetical protein
VVQVEWRKQKAVHRGVAPAAVPASVSLARSNEEHWRTSRDWTELAEVQRHASRLCSGCEHFAHVIRRAFTLVRGGMPHGSAWACLLQFACSRKGREHGTRRRRSSQFPSLNSSTLVAPFGGANVKESFPDGASSVQFL